MSTILVCMQHELTKDQVASLVPNYGDDIFHMRDGSPRLFAELSNCPSDVRRLKYLAKELADYMLQDWSEFSAVVLPIGSPAFMFALAFELGGRMGLESGHGNGHLPNDLPVKILFAHSERESIDKPQPDGSVVKTSVFRFVDWIVL